MTMPSHSEFTTDGSSDTYKLIACEVCGSKLVPSELNLGQQAMCDDLVKVNDPRVCKRYPIEISLCPTCLTAHQVHRIKKRRFFPLTIITAHDSQRMYSMEWRVLWMRLKKPLVLLPGSA